MTGLIYIDVAIGIAYAFVLFSLAAAALQEAIAGLLNSRAAALKAGVKRMLEDTFDDVWDSDLITSLKSPAGPFSLKMGRRDPSHVPPRIVAAAIAEAFEVQGLDRTAAIQRLEDFVEDARLNKDDAHKQNIAKVAKRLMAFIRSAKGEIADVEKAIADYFDQTMDVVSVWYKARVKQVLFVIGFGLSAILNFGVINYADRLLNEQEFRAQIVAEAGKLKSLEGFELAKAEASKGTDVHTETVELLALYDKQIDALEASFSATGWTCMVDDGRGGKKEAEGIANCLTVSTDGYAIFSWILMGLAVTLGAQFWFDVLTKFFKARNTIVTSG